MAVIPASTIPLSVPILFVNLYLIVFVNLETNFSLVIFK